MCGILAAFGKEAHKFVKERIDKLSHRGPDGTSIYEEVDVSIGFTRLAINDTSATGMQPVETECFVSVVNGEIYNFEELKVQFQYAYSSECDSYIVPYLWQDLNRDIIHALDGFYSGLIWDKTNKKLFTVRDYIGKKPLFIVNYGDLMVLTSELKVLPNVTNFQMVPKGVTSINTKSGKVETISTHTKPVPVQDFRSTETAVRKLLENAVYKRIPKGQHYGVFLSGGLDSSIITSIVHENKINQSVKYYILGDPGDSTDGAASKEVIDYLGIKNHVFVQVPKKEELIKPLIEEVVYATESYNPSIISNGIGTYLLSKRAHEDGVKVILSGEGADEMFFGYHNILPKDTGWRDIQHQLLQDMCFTELRRVDLAAMAHSIEIRCPFLDKKLYLLVQQLDYNDFFTATNNDYINKKVVRDAFLGHIPDSIIRRKKTSFDVGTGLRKVVVNYLRKNQMTEKGNLKNIWRNTFPNFENEDESYYHSYPVFDVSISNRGAVHK